MDNHFEEARTEDLRQIFREWDTEINGERNPRQLAQLREAYATAVQYYIEQVGPLPDDLLAEVPLGLRNGKLPDK